MIIIGLDPGTATTGFGLIEKQDLLSVIRYGCIKTKASLSRSKRLQLIHSKLSKIIRDFKPDIAAVEDIFFFKNLKTALKVSEARGVIMLTCAQQGLPVFEYSPLQIKQAITGYGKADKAQMKKMVQALLKLEKIPQSDDAADALATAICCANSLSVKQYE